MCTKFEGNQSMQSMIYNYFCFGAKEKRGRKIRRKSENKHLINYFQIWCERIWCPIHHWISGEAQQTFKKPSLISHLYVYTINTLETTHQNDAVH